MDDKPILNDEKRALEYGAQPGLRFACVLDGKGGCRELDWSELKRWSVGWGTLWVHLERDDPAAQRWLREESGIDPVTCEALLAEESRPRVEDMDDALLVVLRGVNRTPQGEALELVPIHLWIDAYRVISLRDKDHYLLALRDIRESFAARKGPTGPGDLFVRIAEKVVKYMEPVLDEMEEQADHLDATLLETDSAVCRAELGELRRRAISYRRYLSPQREAMFRLQIEDASWLSKRDKVKLREVTDKLLRHVEGLDALRDRTTLLHEDLTAHVNEQIAKNSHRLTVVAAVLLPPSLVAGLLGVNVGGIPGADSPLAFIVVCVLVLAILPLEFLLLRRLGWF
jgi:zinc transporter